MTTLNENYPVRVVEASRQFIGDSRNTSPSISTSASSILIGNDLRQGQTNPGWRDKIERQVDASSGYWRTVVTPRRPALLAGAATKYYEPTFPYRIDTNYRIVAWGQPQWSNDTDTGTYNRALSKIKKQLNSRIGSVQMLAPIAEISELRGLIRQATFLGVNFASAVLAARRTHGRSVYRFLTESWLGFNFALAPLVADIAAVGQAIADYLNRNDIRSRLTASATLYGSATYVPATSVLMPLFFKALTAKGQVSYKLSYRFTGGFHADVKSAEDYSLLAHLGIGLDQIPATLWELTAFSWMFDYFANIGEYLSDVFTSPSGQTDYLVCTRRYTAKCIHTFEVTPHSFSVNHMVVNGITNGASEIEIFRMQRTVLTQLPHASLYFRSADQVAANALSKLLNTLSVLRLDGLGNRFRPIKA